MQIASAGRTNTLSPSDWMHFGLVKGFVFTAPPYENTVKAVFFILFFWHAAACTLALSR